MSLADGTALYRIWGDNAVLLYIGISDDFGQRWKSHARQQPWWDEMRRLTVDEWFTSREEAEAAEILAIQAERPRYNKAHASTPRPGLPPLDPDGHLLTVGDLAGRWELPSGAIRRLIAAERAERGAGLEAVKIGGAVRIFPAAATAYEGRLRAQQTPAPEIPAA